MPHTNPPDPRPSDLPFLLVTLIAARKAGDWMLEALARDWPAVAGIRVVFADALGNPNAGEGVRS